MKAWNHSRNIIYWTFVSLMVGVIAHAQTSPPVPQGELPSGLVDADEPAIFQQEGLVAKPKSLEAREVEEQTAVLMEQDKPGYIPLFFDPERNGVIYAHQEIEYDLTNPLILRVGPLAVTAAGVGLRLSRELGEFFEFEFGMDLRKNYANMYMLSFQWPVDLVPDGVIELFSDDGKVLWRREANEEHVAGWRRFVDKSQRNLGVRAGAPRPQTTGHEQSSFGLFGREIFEIPVWKINEPFRFCVTKDAPEGRVAICSKRYRFNRRGGRYWVVAESKTVLPKVMVNDKPVTLKGSAVFIDDKRPIKFAALMGNGTYFEFVSFPKRINIVDMVLNEETKRVELIGFGPPPLGEVARIERVAPDYWDFLNFKPTIGDFRKFWMVSYPAQGGSLYLRGYGGAPFKQPFVYERLPRKTARPRINIKSAKSTYRDTTTLIGETTASVKVASNEKSAVNLTGTEFKWEFMARNRGEMNAAKIEILDGDHKFEAFHEIYKGFPREVSLRTTGVLTNNLELVVLGEIAAQWWFEKLFGWENRNLSHQRWGVNARYFQSLATLGGGSGNSVIRLQVATADLKYRLTPGVWGRDHTLGFSMNAQHIRVEHYEAQMAGVGAFWARSMPSFLDRIFNLAPFMRYPKWVDVEGIFYALPLKKSTRLGVNTAVNFHGKVLWSQRFFGEAGFGLKLFQFDDLEKRKAVGLAVAYGTVGIGYNF